MAAWLDICRYFPTAGGTTDWTFSAAVTGYASPALAGVVNGRAYKYRAESGDLTQWELGEGTYNTGTGVLTRTTVLYNSAGTGTASGQSGAGTKINFSSVPQVAIVALKEDLISIEEANAFTTAQKLQARTNIGGSQALYTRQVFASGSGTYTTPANCIAINVRMVGGGGGGGGSGTTSGTAAGAGGNSTFGSSFLTANGGGGGGTAAASTGGGSASGGDIGIAGGAGDPGAGAGVGSIATTGTPFGRGGNSVFGGGAAAQFSANAGNAGVTNSGGGGGGGMGPTAAGQGGSGGGAGGYLEKLISSPNATYAYAVGAAGTAGTAGTSGQAGGAGGSGLIIVDEYY